MEPPITHLGSPALSLGTPLPTFQPSDHHTTPVTSVHDIGTLAGHGPVTSIHDAIAETHPAVTSVQDLQGLSGHAPVTSVSDLNHHTEASPSTTHGEDSRYSIYDTKTSSETGRNIQAARAHREEVKVAKEIKSASEKDPYKIHVGGFGDAFKNRKEDVSGFHKTISRFWRTNRGAYSNFSKENKRFVEDTIATKASQKKVGGHITRLDHKAMRHVAEEKFEKGEVSKEDLRDMREIFKKVDK